MKYSDNKTFYKVFGILALISTVIVFIFPNSMNYLIYFFLSFFVLLFLMIKNSERKFMQTMSRKTKNFTRLTRDEFYDSTKIPSRIKTFDRLNPFAKGRTYLIQKGEFLDKRKVKILKERRINAYTIINADSDEYKHEVGKYFASVKTGGR